MKFLKKAYSIHLIQDGFKTMTKTIEGMIAVSEMVVYEGMIKLEKNKEFDDTKLDKNFHDTITNIVEKTSHSDITMLIKEYSVSKAVALTLRMDEPLNDMTKKVVLYHILRKEVSVAMSEDKYKCYKEWKKVRAI
jgi:hypothetical protein